MSETTIPCGWCDKPVAVTDDHGQVVYCSEDHERANTYHGEDIEGMSAKVTKLHKRMTKAELIHHIETGHSQAASKPIVPHRWTMDSLTDLHRLIHLGLGR